MTKTKRLLTLLGGLAMLAACGDLTVPDLNNPGLDELRNAPSRSAVVDAVQGLMIGSRTGISGQTGYVAHLGILGRESWTVDNADPRYVDEMIAGILDPGNGAFGGSGWTARYRNIRNGFNVLNALERGEGFSEPEKEAIRGFVKTLQALDFLLVVNMRDRNGAVVDVDRDVGEDLAPFVSRDAALQHVASLLDEARAHLAAGGAEFPFRLSSGFAGFDTPASFVRFNRALAARVAVYRGDYADALTALGNSFVSTSAPLDLGVYYAFGTGAGDQNNTLFQATSPTMVPLPSLRTDAQQQPDGTPDDRLLRKTAPLSPAFNGGPGLVSDLRFTVYGSLSSPIPVIRNEELILLRAEARWFTGDRAGAMADLNFVRQASGGLAPIAQPASDEAFVTALLRERRYSLLFEGGHRWIDHRRFGRLSELPLARSTDVVPVAFPVPRDECIARDLPVPCGV